MSWLSDRVDFVVGLFIAMLLWFVRLEVRLSRIESRAEELRNVEDAMNASIQKIFDRIDILSRDTARIAGACDMCRKTKQ